jgi:hypothetical protein
MSRESPEERQGVWDEATDAAGSVAAGRNVRRGPEVDLERPITL